jgi:hypothetical protein
MCSMEVWCGYGYCEDEKGDVGDTSGQWVYTGWVGGGP